MSVDKPRDRQPKKARKKPIEIEFMRFRGDNMHAIASWVKWHLECYPCDDWVFGKKVILIPTLEGTMTARRGDYIIRGTRGEFYPCKPAIFAETYDVLEEVGDAKP